MRLRLRRPALGTVLGATALFVALGGVSAADQAITSAARKISGNTLKNGSVKGSKLARNSVTGAKIKDGSIARVDLAAGVAGPGPAGPAGPKGDPGPPATLAPATGDVTGTYPALEIAPGKLTGQDVGGFTGVLLDLPIGTLDAGQCSTQSSTALTPIVVGQNLLDDVIVVTPPQGFQKNALTVYAQPDSANQIAVTVCNVGGADNLNVGLRDFRYLTIDTP